MWDDPNNPSSAVDGYYLYHWVLGSTEKKRFSVGQDASCPLPQPEDSTCYTVDGLEPGQSYQFEVTAYADDGANESEPSPIITHYVANPNEVVVDNTAANFTGNWSESVSVAGFLNYNYHGISAGTPNAAATWQPNLPESGLYLVSAWWTAHPRRAPDAPYTIHHEQGQTTVRMDQTQLGSQWVDLGTYRFKAGNAGQVVLSAEAGGNYIVADAVRFTLQTRADELDFDRDGLSDQQEYDLGTDPYLADSDGDGLQDGVEVNQHGTHPNLADSDGDGTDDGTEIAEGRNPLVADHSEPRPNEFPVNIIVDNRYAAYTGDWAKSTAQPGFFGYNYRVATPSPTDATAAWQPHLPFTGTYHVFARWTAEAERTTQAPYTILHAEGSDTVVVDQTQHGGEWVELGTYYFVAGTEGLVTLSNDTTGASVVADAVRFVLDQAESLAEPIQDEIIGDNPDAIFTESWQVSTSTSGYFGNNYHSIATGNGDATATWQPDLPFAGVYDVYARWTAHAQRATHAPYTVIHAEGDDIVEVDQTQNGGEWVRLGTYRFAPGMEGMVVLTNDSPGNWVVADAVRFVLLEITQDPNRALPEEYPEPEPESNPLMSVVERIVDNHEADLVGPWGTSTTITGFVGDHYHGLATGGGEATATWRPDLPVPGVYQVFARWTAHAKRATNAPYTVVHQEGTDTVEIDQTQNGGEWISLGTYAFAAGTNGTVTLSNDSPGNWIVADAIRFVLVDESVERIADNHDAVFVGDWKISTSITGFYGSDYHGIATGDGLATVTWQPDLPVTGFYEVFARWTAHAKRATNAPYTLFHADGADTVEVNQTQNGGEWVSLGTYAFEAGTSGAITLSNDSPGNWVVADAIRFVLK